MPELLDILHEDDSILAVNKPAGLVCHPTKGDAWSSLVGRLRLYLGESVPPRMINRLDRETSGVVLVGKTPAAARELGRLWEDRAVQKQYLAIVHGTVAGESGSVEAPLGRHPASPVVIKDAVVPGGLAARTDYQTLSRFSRGGADYSLLEVMPRTGRKHQIRIHLSHAGHPIVGDKIYGPDEQIYLRFVAGQETAADWERLVLPHQALHAGQVRFEWNGAPWRFEARPEAWFLEFAGL